MTKQSSSTCYHSFLLDSANIPNMFIQVSVDGAQSRPEHGQKNNNARETTMPSRFTLTTLTSSDSSNIPRYVCFLLIKKAKQVQQCLGVFALYKKWNRDTSLHIIIYTDICIIIFSLSSSIHYRPLPLSPTNPDSVSILSVLYLVSYVAMRGGNFVSIFALALGSKQLCCKE